jgi:hypothetical protein
VINRHSLQAFSNRISRRKLGALCRRYTQGRIVISDTVAIGIQVGKAVGNADNLDDSAIG